MRCGRSSSFPNETFIVLFAFDQVLLTVLLTSQSLEYPLWLFDLARLKSVLPVVWSAQKTYHPSPDFAAVRGW